MPKYRVHVSMTAIVQVEAKDEAEAAAKLADACPVMGDYRLCDLDLTTQTLGQAEDQTLAIDNGRHELRIDLVDGRLSASLSDAKMIG